MHHTTFQQNPQHSSVKDTRPRHGVPKKCDTITLKGSGGPPSRWTQEHNPSEHHPVTQHHIEYCKNLSTKEFKGSGNTVWSLEFCIPNTSVVINKNAGLNKKHIPTNKHAVPFEMSWPWQLQHDVLADARLQCN